MQKNVTIQKVKGPKHNKKNMKQNENKRKELS